MTTTAIIDAAGVVQNLILAHVVDVDPQALGYPADWVAIGAGGGAIGDTWDGTQFVRALVPEPEQVVPETVTMRAARRALLDAGLLAQVDAAIDTLPSPQKEQARIDWEYGQVVERHSPFVAALAPALGLTDDDLDALFLAAEAFGV